MKRYLIFSFIFIISFILSLFLNINYINILNNYINNKTKKFSIFFNIENIKYKPLNSIELKKISIYKKDEKILNFKNILISLNGINKYRVNIKDNGLNIFAYYNNNNVKLDIKKLIKKELTLKGKIDFNLKTYALKANLDTSLLTEFINKDITNIINADLLYFKIEISGKNLIYNFTITPQNNNIKGQINGVIQVNKNNFIDSILNLDIKLKVNEMPVNYKITKTIRELRDFRL